MFLEVHIESLQPGDVVTHIMDHGGNWHRMGTTKTTIVERRTNHYVATHVFGERISETGSWMDWGTHWLKARIEHKREYANPERAAALRAYLEAVCRL